MAEVQRNAVEKREESSPVVTVLQPCKAAWLLEIQDSLQSMDYLGGYLSCLGGRVMMERGELPRLRVYDSRDPTFSDAESFGRKASELRRKSPPLTQMVLPRTQDRQCSPVRSESMTFLQSCCIALRRSIFEMKYT